MPLSPLLLTKVLTALLAVAMIAGCTAEARKARHLARAESYLKSGEYEKAKIEYINVLRADQENATAFRQLGIIWFEQGAPLRAAPFLYKSRELSPNDFETRIKLARVFLVLGQVPEARKEALAVLEQSPKQVDALLLLTETDRTRQDMELTEQQLQKFSDRKSVSFHLATGNLALRKNDLPSAESAARAASTLDPKSPSAHLALGMLSLLKKNQAQAGEEFKTAAELAPLRSVERLKYAEFKSQTGGAEEAKTALKEITRQAPDFLPAWQVTAQIAFIEKQYDESLTLLENVIARDPDNIDARTLQTDNWMAKGEIKQAVDGLERLDRTYPNSSIIKYKLAGAYLQNNNRVQAATALNQSIAANPNYLEPNLLLGELNLRNGNPQPVVAAMSELLTTQPGLVKAQLLLADAYRALGRLDEAAGVFRDQIKAAPRAALPQLFLGIVLRQQKKIDEARAAFEKASELDPRELSPAEQLIDLDLSAGNYEAAAQRVQSQLQKTPQVAAAHFMEAKVYFAQGKWDQAEVAVQKTLDLDPSFSRAYDLLVSTYITSNKLPEAMKQLEALLSKTPNNTQALMVSALIYEKRSDFPKARDAYEKVLSITPDAAAALNNLAFIYAEQLNQLDKASELAGKARILLPADPSIADTAGWILYKQGDYQQAVALLQESATKLPDNPEIQFHLGMACYMMGQKEMARAAFEQATKAPKDFPGKAEAQRRLALLGDSSGLAKELSTEELESLLKEQPNDPVALIRLAESYERQGASAKSASAYEQAVKLNPKLLSAIVKLAQLYGGPLQNKDKALELAKKARELAPNDAKVTGAIGTLAYQSGNFTWSYSLLQEAARQLPDDAAVQYRYAWAAYSLGKLKEAREAMKRALEILPDGPEAEDANAFLALVLDNESGKGGALNDATLKRLQPDPNYVPSLMVQASGLSESGESKQAEAIYLRVRERFPDFAPAQKALARAYADDPSKTAKAYDLAMKARKVLSDDAELARTLGQLAYIRKEYPRAIQLLHESDRKRALDAKGFYYLGMSHFQAKQKSLARDVLDRAIAAGLQEPMAAEARQALNDLEKN